MVRGLLVVKVLGVRVLKLVEVELAPYRRRSEKCQIEVPGKEVLVIWWMMCLRSPNFT